MRQTSWPRGREETTVEDMQPLKAHVHNGRLVLDEPTDLPEGEVVYLQPLDSPVAADHDDLDDEERAALHRELDASLRQAAAGETDDFDAVLTELRQRP
jgi:hypothetical protein